MAIKYIDELAPEQLHNKKVIARFDFNVPLNSKGEITDSTRLDYALDTIRFLINSGVSKLIMMSHLGRPKGKKDPKLSLEPIALYLADKLGEEVVLTESATDRGIKTLMTLKGDKLILLENLRFHPEETAGESQFAKTLASYGDIYLNDAFGTCHREHASTYQIIASHKNTCFAGKLLKKEIQALTRITESPKAPFVAIVGGAKISDKIKIIERLLPNVTRLIVGGAMAYPFLKAKGATIGKSLCNDEDVKLAKKLLTYDKNNKIMLPIDHKAAASFDANDFINCEDQNIPDDYMGLDIGNKTIDLFRHEILGAQTILWNGPMGIFEKELFSTGTFSIARAIEEANAFSVVGGGDSVSAINKAGVKNISHVSTGGGASLEFIENGTLPGIRALRFGIN